MGKTGQKVNRKKTGLRRVVQPRASPKPEVCACLGQGELGPFQGNFDYRIASFKILEYGGGKKKILEM